MTGAGKSRRGFASMDPARVREIGGLGGKAAVNRHRWTSEEAKEVGRKGGIASAANKRAAAAQSEPVQP